MIGIDSEEIFKEIIKAEKAIVLIYFNWSVQALLSRKIFHEWVNEWKHKHSISTIKIAESDGDNEFTWDWLRNDVRELNGAGSLVWIKNGEIVNYLRNITAIGVKEIAQITNEVFGEK